MLTHFSGTGMASLNAFFSSFFPFGLNSGTFHVVGMCEKENITQLRKACHFHKYMLDEISMSGIMTI